MPVNDGQTVETVWMPDGDGGEAGDGSEAGNRFAAGDDLCFEPDWLRGELPVLLDGEAGDYSQSDGG